MTSALSLLRRQLNFSTCIKRRFIATTQRTLFKSTILFECPSPLAFAQRRSLLLTAKSASSVSPILAASKQPASAPKPKPTASSPFTRSPPPLESHIASACTITFEQLQDALNDEGRTKPNFAQRHPSSERTTTTSSSDPPARNLLVVDVREKNEIEQLGAMPGAVIIPRARALFFPQYFLSSDHI